MDDDYVTKRKNKIHDYFDNSFNSTRSEIRPHSLPDLSLGYNSDEEALREEMKKLQDKLDSANGEIDNLCSEMSVLRKQNIEQQKTIENLKKLITGSESYVGTCASTKKKLRRQSRQIHNDTSFDESNLSFQELKSEKQNTKIINKKNYKYDS